MKITCLKKIDINAHIMAWPSHNFIRAIILITKYWSWYVRGFSHNCFKTLKNVSLDLYLFKVFFYHAT
jgi:hypothetical protein